MKRIIILIVLLLVGCGQQPVQDTGNIYTGTQGLVMEFIPNMPPDTMYATDDGSGNDMLRTDPHNWYIQFSNKGAYPNNNQVLIGKLYLIGFDHKLTWGNSPYIIHDINSNDMGLYGKSLAYPEGGMDVYEAWKNLNFRIPKETDSYTTTLKALLCYDYRTHASAEICIDPDPTKTGENTCTPGVIKMNPSQGAPVAVTNIEVISTKGKSILTFKLKNVGGGQVILADDYEDCRELPFEKKDISVIVRATVGGDQIYGATSYDPKDTNVNSGNCQPSWPRFVNGEAQIYCTIEGLTGTSSYSTVTTLELLYGYKTSISKNIKVVKI